LWVKSEWTGSDNQQNYTLNKEGMEYLGKPSHMLCFLPRAPAPAQYATASLNQ
jgi:hypothetical protein